MQTSVPKVLLSEECLCEINPPVSSQSIEGCVTGSNNPGVPPLGIAVKYGLQCNHPYPSIPNLFPLPTLSVPLIRKTKLLS